MVDVVNGAVSLTGTVPSQAQCTEAAVAARRAAGVTTVDTLLAGGPDETERLTRLVAASPGHLLFRPPWLMPVIHLAGEYEYGACLSRGPAGNAGYPAHRSRAAASARRREVTRDESLASNRTS